MASSLALCTECADSDGPIDDLARYAKKMQILNLYHCIQRFIGTKNPAQMQRFFEPLSVIYEKDEGLKHSKKYRNYARGDHLPNDDTMRVMIELTGQDWDFEKLHMLWLALDLSVALQPMKMLLHCLGGVQEEQLALDLHACLVAGNTQKVSFLCWKLLLVPGLPSLTALIVVLRIAHDMERQKAASTIAYYLALKLIFMGAELQQRGIANLFYRLAVHHLFPLAKDWKIDITPLGLGRRSLMFNLLPFCSRGVTANTRMGQGKREEIMVLWQSQCFGRMIVEAVSLRVVEGGHRELAISVQDHWRRQATTQFIDYVGRVNHQSRRILDRDYLNPDVDFRLIGKHNWAEVRSHLDQLANS